jgi:hypothetical protein
LKIRHKQEDKAYKERRVLRIVIEAGSVRKSVKASVSNINCHWFCLEIQVCYGLGPNSFFFSMKKQQWEKIYFGKYGFIKNIFNFSGKCTKK